MIPRSPDRVTTSQLVTRLRARGFEVDLRTVQRDLKEMADSQIVALGCDDEYGGKEYRWFWPVASPRTEFPVMSAPTALSFLMVEQFMTQLLPPAVHAQLGDYFASARAVLKSDDSERRVAADWPNKVRVVPLGQPLLAPDIPAAVLDGVYTALLHDWRFQATYHPRSEEGAARDDYIVNPIALVVRNHLIYLIATLWDYDDIKHLPLHRFSRVTLLDRTSRTPEGFDLDTYLYGNRAFDIPDPNGRKIKLVVRFTEGAAYHLRETPLSEDQRIEPAGAGWVKLTATVLDTEQLWWWLRGFGDAVEVVESDVF